MPLLVPGIGAQGGDLQAVLAAGLDEKGKGLIINSSRSIIFANNPASEAKKLKDNINQFINNE
jgi:orotidine-5'-phosphate decarboxylase